MIKAGFFPTFLYAKDLNLDIKLFEKEILEWSKRDKGLKKTNVKGWHSQTNMQTMPVFKPLIDELYKMQQEIYKEEMLDKEPTLGNMWANINYKDGFNRPHVHANSFFSGAYYIKVPKNSGQIKFNDPRGGPKYVFPARKKGIELPNHLWTEVHVEPIENRVLMFPAWLEHCVDPNESDDIRISISFNFTQHGIF